MGKLTQEVFNESCCDDGRTNSCNSAQPCGCDPGIGHVCQNCQERLKEYTFARYTEQAAQQDRSRSAPHAIPSALGLQNTLGLFVTKDSGQREVFESGMVRDTEEGKDDYALVYDGPMLRRWVQLLTRGAKKYLPRNWMLAVGEPERQRFRASAARHFAQWMGGEVDEDHAAAVIFNINGAEYVKERMKE